MSHRPFDAAVERLRISVREMRGGRFGRRPALSGLSPPRERRVMNVRRCSTVMTGLAKSHLSYVRDIDLALEPGFRA